MRINELITRLYLRESLAPKRSDQHDVGSEILKAGFGWTDLELADQMTFNIQVRHPLGFDELVMEVPELRTVHNAGSAGCASTPKGTARTFFRGNTVPLSFLKHLPCM